LLKVKKQRLLPRGAHAANDDVRIRQPNLGFILGKAAEAVHRPTEPQPWNSFGEALAGLHGNPVSPADEHHTSSFLLRTPQYRQR
jgi:hypothetical protein